jgi:hypothetical protein
MSKSLFWKLFRKAWDTAFTEELIQNAWKKASLWPLNPTLVICQITRPEPPVAISEAPKTPFSSKGIRRLQRIYQFNPSTDALKLLFKCSLKLAAQHEIDEHVKAGLFKSLDIEKNKRRRPKAIGLAKDEERGAQLWSPTKVQRAKAELAEKQAIAEQEKLERVDAKAQKAARDIEQGLQKELRRQERAEAAAAKQAIKAAKSKAYQERLAANQAAKAAKAIPQVPKTIPAKLKPVLKANTVVTAIEKEGRVAKQVSVSARGRTRKPTKKYGA